MAKSQKRHSWWYPSTSSNTAERPIFSAYALKCVYDSTLLIFQKNSFLPTYSRYWQRLLFDYLLTYAKTKKRRRFSSSPLLVNHRGFFRSAEALVHRLRRYRTARPLRGRACHRHPQLRSDPFGFESPLFLPQKNNGDGKNRLRYLVNHRGFEPRTP